MQVVLGSRGDYPVRAVLYLARHPGRRRSHDIAAAMEIPAKYLPQILGALVQAGLARSTAGRLGGYELARAPASITLQVGRRHPRTGRNDAATVAAPGPRTRLRLCKVAERTKSRSRNIPRTAARDRPKEQA
jgi:hypothetical protein